MKSITTDPSRLLAQTLKAIRGTESQVQFARKIGVSGPSLNRLEAGQQNVTIASLGKIADRLGCSVGDLFLDQPGLELAKFKTSVNRLVEVRDEAEREVERLKRRRPKDEALHQALDAALGEFRGKIEGMATSGSGRSKGKRKLAAD